MISKFKFHIIISIIWPLLFLPQKTQQPVPLDAFIFGVYESVLFILDSCNPRDSEAPSWEPLSTRVANFRLWRCSRMEAMASESYWVACHPGAIFSAANSKSTDRLLEHGATARVYVAEAGAVGAEALQNKQFRKRWIDPFRKKNALKWYW